jgi:hypothetical protein
MGKLDSFIFLKFSSLIIPTIRLFQYFKLANANGSSIISQFIVFVLNSKSELESTEDETLCDIFSVDDPTIISYKLKQGGRGILT